MIDETSARVMVQAIEAERGAVGVVNDLAGGDGLSGNEDDLAPDEERPIAKLTAQQLKELLEKRERQMQEGVGTNGVTDQWRVYRYCVDSMSGRRYLRLVVQASAGTGKATANCVGRFPTGTGKADVVYLGRGRYAC